MHPAVEALRTRQRQIDEDGCEVAVSRQAVDETVAEVERLEKLVFVPGMMKCAKCGFVGMHMVLRASDGAVGVKADLEPERCPNGCGPLWRVSERDSGNETCDRLEKSVMRQQTLEKALEAVRQELWVDYCLRMGRTDTNPEPFKSKPHIRIIDDALKLSN